MVEVVLEGDGPKRRAVGVRLADGRHIRARSVISNATHWDTFDNLLPQKHLPPSEDRFRQRYKKSPAFLSIHAGVRADVLPPGAWSPFLRASVCSQRCLSAHGNAKACLHVSISLRVFARTCVHAIA